MDQGPSLLSHSVSVCPLVMVAINFLFRLSVRCTTFSFGYTSSFPYLILPLLHVKQKNKTANTKFAFIYFLHFTQRDTSKTIYNIVKEEKAIQNYMNWTL